MRKWVGLFVTGCSSGASTTEPVDNLVKKKEVENVSADELLNKTEIAVEYNQLLIGDKPDTWKILVRDDKTIAIMNFIKTLPGGDSAYKAWMGERAMGTGSLSHYKEGHGLRGVLLTQL
ncbi:hypothetical protein [Pseudalkalibacillus hwajinpoensis]|uniref:Uncharacterized protein n=1 Tax=Guptibacillus hwajinpoensis TaxID=208199 RepID=A0A4U1MJQ2_9BACL|nr:hypothetical protein [Pseudalkalibacillus hwajinpoensis]TKD70746.1 hypothetical protein FBF83_09000 [Pseudalkalibacillus hwajinpoensis]